MAASPLRPFVPAALLAAALLAAAPALGNESREPPNPKFTDAITADQVLARTAHLASEELAGRTGGGVQSALRST